MQRSGNPGLSVNHAPTRIPLRCMPGYWKATSAKLRSLRLCKPSRPRAQVLVDALAVEVVGHAGYVSCLKRGHAHFVDTRSTHLFRAPTVMA